MAIDGSTDFPCEELGGKLKTFFDGVTAGPMPDRLTKLAAQLEAAVERGDLTGSCQGSRRKR